MRIFAFETSRERRKRAFIESIQEKACDYFIANFQRLNPEDFVMGACRHNLKCFFNAVHEGVENNLSVHLVFCIDNINANEQEIFLHVINKNQFKWQDNTLGYFQKNYEYYYIKEVLPDSYNLIGGWFEDMRKRYISLFDGTDGVKKYNLNSSELF